MKRIKKEHLKEIMDKVRKAGDSDNYETSWDEKGIPTSKKISNIKKGRKSRAAGARFELKVRTQLEEKGWIMDKWTNNVDLEESKLVKAKRKYNPFKKVMVIGTGFPDFIAFRRYERYYEIIGVEVKMNGTLSKVEKQKCKWLIENNVFSRILIAKKAEKRGQIDFIDFKEKYWDKLK